MSRHKGVVLTLIGLWKPGKPLKLPQGAEQLLPPRQRLVDVALVSHIEHQPVLGGIKNAVDSHRKLHRTQIGRKMPAGAGHLLYQKLPQLQTQQLCLFFSQTLHVRRRMYRFQDQRIYAPFFSDKDAAHA